MLSPEALLNHVSFPSITIVKSGLVCAVLVSFPETENAIDDTTNTAAAAAHKNFFFIISLHIFLIQ